MGVLLFILFLIISILSQNHVYAENNNYLSDPLNTTIKTASSTKPIGEFILSFHNVSLGPYAPRNIVKQAGILKAYLRKRVNLIIENIVDDSDNKKELEHLFNNIAETYEEALRIQKRSFESFNESINTTSLDKSMKKIKAILTNENTDKFLANNYKEEIKKFQSTCALKMSHMQSLDALLSHVQIAMAQNLVVKYLHTQKKSNNNKVSDEKLGEMIKDVEAHYSEIAATVKLAMAKASRDFIMCDTRSYKDDILHVENQDLPYAELQLLSLYYLQMNKDKSLSECKKIKNQDYCAYQNICEKLDPNAYGSVRSCPNGFFKCDKLFPDVTDESIRWNLYKTACNNENKTAYERYDPVYETLLYEEQPPACEGKKIPNVMEAHKSFRYCECLCSEKNYYFVRDIVGSNYNENRVVTGARLVVKGAFILIQIQEAKILANGSIDKNTLYWQPVINPEFPPSKFRRMLEPVDLTEVHVPDGHVVTGLKFYPFLSDSKQRVKLAVQSHAYDHVTGKLDVKHRINLPDDATVEYKTHGLRAATRSPKPNMLISKTNQYIAFNITDPNLEGGQTTIPFIDTQKVESDQPTALSGAGLYLRGQPGFGGFIALKLFSYNIQPYVYIGSNNDDE